MQSVQPKTVKILVDNGASLLKCYINHFTAEHVVLSST